jgi:transposase
MELTNEEWQVVAALLAPEKVRADGGGRPWRDQRTVFNGVLWVLRTGAPWKDLPPRYGSYQTAHRRFQQWVRSGVMETMLLGLAEHLRQAGGLDLQECFVDGTFVPAKKGGGTSARPSAAKAPKSWALRTATVFLSPCGQQALRRRK